MFTTCIAASIGFMCYVQETLTRLSVCSCVVTFYDELGWILGHLVMVFGKKYYDKRML